MVELCVHAHLHWINLGLGLRWYRGDGSDGRAVYDRCTGPVRSSLGLRGRLVKSNQLSTAKCVLWRMLLLPHRLGSVLGRESEDGTFIEKLRNEENDTAAPGSGPR